MSSIIIRIITIVPQELFWNEITVMRIIYLKSSKAILLYHIMQKIPYIAKDIYIEHHLNRIFKPIYQLQISNNVYNNILLPFD